MTSLSCDLEIDGKTYISKESSCLGLFFQNSCSAIPAPSVPEHYRDGHDCHVHDHDNGYDCHVIVDSRPSLKHVLVTMIPNDLIPLTLTWPPVCESEFFGTAIWFDSPFRPKLATLHRPLLADASGMN